MDVYAKSFLAMSLGSENRTQQRQSSVTDTVLSAPSKQALFTRGKRTPILRLPCETEINHASPCAVSLFPLLNTSEEIAPN